MSQPVALLRIQQPLARHSKALRPGVSPERVLASVGVGSGLCDIHSWRGSSKGPKHVLLFLSLTASFVPLQAFKVFERMARQDDEKRRRELEAKLRKKEEEEEAAASAERVRVAPAAHEVEVETTEEPEPSLDAGGAEGPQDSPATLAAASPMPAEPPGAAAPAQPSPAELPT